MKAQPLIDEIRRPLTTEEHLAGMNELMIVALPMPVVKLMQEAAQKRNMGLAEFLAAAIDNYLKAPVPGE